MGCPNRLCDTWNPLKNVPHVFCSLTQSDFADFDPVGRKNAVFVQSTSMSPVSRFLSSALVLWFPLSRASYVRQTWIEIDPQKIQSGFFLPGRSWG